MTEPDLVRLHIVPITISDACYYVKQHHRHHKPPQGALFALAVSRISGDDINGVAIVGRPVSRLTDDGWTAEVTRCCTDGTRNACSMLYRAAWRAAKAMGYRKLITYTLYSENGSSLRAAGFQLLGQCGGGSWDRSSRPRVDKHPTQMKLKWELT